MRYTICDKKEIADRILEIQAMQLIAGAQIRALSRLSAEIWKSQGIRMPEDKPIEAVMRHLAKKELTKLLASFAEVDPEGSARLKMFFEKTSKRHDPFE